MNSLVQICKSAGFNTREIYQQISFRSLKAAHEEQSMTDLIKRLRMILPNIQDQYTDPAYSSGFNEYWELKTRGMHAFQIEFIASSLASLPTKSWTVVDVGDSSGNHGLYLKHILGDSLKRMISVNLDPLAVEKAKRKGIEAQLVRAEDLRLDHPVDLYMSLQMVEHLFDPVRFMHGLAKDGNSEHFIFSVPFRPQSQVGLHELRLNHGNALMDAETTHIFELSPADWALLARFSGWRLIGERTYFQYPKRHPLRATKPIWDKYDFPGFWAGLFKKDLSIAHRYKSW